MNSEYRPWIIAHRGARLDAPENTRSAFDLALSYPIDGIELDVQLTQDGISVIYHDRTLSKFKKPHKRLSDYQYDELCQKSWRSCYNGIFKEGHIITLDEVLRLYSRKTRLLIEIKSRPWDRQAKRSQALTAKVIDSIRNGVPKSHHPNIFLLSFDITVLDFAHQIAPNWNYVLNVSEPDLAVVNMNVHLDHLYGICISVRKLATEFSNWVRTKKKALFIYTCNSPKDVNLALNSDADVIMTDKPGWILQYLERRSYIQ